MADAAQIFTMGIPTLAVLMGTLVNNSRLTDLGSHIDSRFNDVDRRIEDTRDLLRAELLRVEQVLDARVKHLKYNR